MSVGLSIRMEQLAFQWVGFMKFDIWIIIENMWIKLKFSWNVTRIAGILMKIDKHFCHIWLDYSWNEKYFMWTL
jgi:hypothetical protein